MPESVNFQIRISGENREGAKNLTIGELGVLLTGINRALNKAVDTSPRYSPTTQEPASVHAEVVRVENGSVILTIAASLADFAQANILQPAFLAGIFGNAAWDFTKLLSREVSRALKRVGNDVQIEMERVEPVFDSNAPLNIGTKGLPSLASSVVATTSSIPSGGNRTFDQRSSYSVSFEHQNGAQITVKYSAMPR